MRLLLLSLLFTLPLNSFSQFPAFSASYVYDSNLGNDLPGSHGMQIGFGTEGITLGQSNLILSYRTNLLILKSRYSTTVDNIEFLMDEGEPNQIGFANIEYSKIGGGLQFDLGYKDWEEAILEPYITAGFIVEENSTWLNYGLYDDTCLCFDNNRTEFKSTTSIGYKTGLGLKIHALENLFIDVRATYYGSRAVGTDSPKALPDINSFHIDNSGTPTVSYQNKPFIRGMNFKVGFIFRLFNNPANQYYTSINDNSDEDTYETNTTEESSSGSTSSSGSCGTLTPAPSRNPPD